MQLRRPALLAFAAVASLTAAGALANPAGPAVAPTAPPPSLPACVADDAVAGRSGYSDWAATLLDPAHALPEGYEPPDLTTEYVAGNPVRLRTFVFGPLRDMLNAAALDRVKIGVTSAYRSLAAQAALENRLGHVDDLVARPGHSEHQLGTALDLNGGANWLEENAWHYGFVLSYPPERSPAWTCYRSEPWHVRYFGITRAAEIEASGLSPREWLWAHSLAE
jgi:D-alanyl-D-alanine carboxypeptidase